MAKVTAPLLSLDAHGALGKAIVYISNRAGNIVKRYIKPRRNPTDENYCQTLYISMASKVWKYGIDPYDNPLPEGLKTSYILASKNNPTTGLNLFVRDYILKNQPLVNALITPVLPLYPGDNQPWQV